MYMLVSTTDPVQPVWSSYGTGQQYYQFSIIIIIIIIIILSIAFFTKVDCLVFTSLYFATTIFFTAQGPQPYVQPPTWRTPPSYRVAHLYPQAQGSLFVTFYDSQGCSGGILTLLHMGQYYELYEKLNSFIEHVHHYLGIEYFTFISCKV
jgi:hypothetical protein